MKGGATVRLILLMLAACFLSKRLAQTRRRPSGAEARPLRTDGALSSGPALRSITISSAHLEQEFVAEHRLLTHELPSPMALPREWSLTSPDSRSRTAGIFLIPPRARHAGRLARPDRA
jgi:hypothetical protein